MCIPVTFYILQTFSCSEVIFLPAQYLLCVPAAGISAVKRQAGKCLSTPSPRARDLGCATSWDDKMNARGDFGEKVFYDLGGYHQGIDELTTDILEIWSHRNIGTHYVPGISTSN